LATLNPDGQNEVVSWYRKNLGTPYEVSPLPDLYQEYVGHDNNRDGYMNNMLESRDVTHTELEWNRYLLLPSPDRAFPDANFYPTVHGAYFFEHQSADGALAERAGHHMAAYLDEHQMPAQCIVWDSTTGIRDSWTSRIFFAQHFFFTETALYRYATPHFLYCR